MTIDADVQAVAKKWAGDCPEFAAWLQSVVRQEGDILKAVRCSVPSVKTRKQALEVLARSSTHRLAQFVYAHTSTAFVDFFGSYWAPVGAKNDPKGLNKHFVPNVDLFWRVK